MIHVALVDAPHMKYKTPTRVADAATHNVSGLQIWVKKTSATAPDCNVHELLWFAFGAVKLLL